MKNIIIYFQDLGYKFQTISDFNNSISTNSKNISITFDDGFKSWLTVDSLFSEFNIKGTFFVNSIFLSEKPPLPLYEKFLRDTKIYEKNKLIDSGSLQTLAKNGHEIGAHTHTHRALRSLSKKDLLYEIEENLKYLKSLQIHPVSFSVPYGMKRLVKNYQIKLLCEYFEIICFGEPGMLFKKNKNLIERYPWKTERSFIYNIENIKTDTSIFNKLTKRSGLG